MAMNPTLPTSEEQASTTDERTTAPAPAPAIAQDAPTAQTLAYYDANAQKFASSTVDVEFSAMQRRFTALLSPGAKVLDFGCGSGRDAKCFLDAGYDVTALDGSAELCRIAGELTGLPVRCELFQDFADTCAYDGIWACSSILHLRKGELAAVLAKLAAALRPGGVLYTSFKLGDFEGMRNGRHFTDFTEQGFEEFMQEVPSLTIEETWTSADVRPGRGGEKWLNVLLRKA